jgi:hypothetical protein
LAQVLSDDLVRHGVGGGYRGRLLAEWRFKQNPKAVDSNSAQPQRMPLFFPVVLPKEFAGSKCIPH